MSKKDPLEIQMAWKLIEALSNPCDDGKPDHAWRKCRRCLAIAELDSPQAKRYLRALVDQRTAHDSQKAL